MKTITVSISYANPDSEAWEPLEDIAFPVTDADDPLPPRQRLKLPSGESIDVSLAHDPDDNHTHLFVHQEGRELFLIMTAGARKAVAVTQFNSVVQLTVDSAES